ncbi:Ig-like domain-containing protein [Pseudomonas machongensis]|uniref:Ig-like domain-containing protein n=1 Tax=Pseudomonas machongensis TaxID=3110229 RepID=UPI00389ABB66
MVTIARPWGPITSSFRRVPLTRPAPQINASYRRAATGGTPPYRYASSDEAIAVVNPNDGTVVATGSGSARITATDSVGNHASYNITFQGVVRLVERRDNQTWFYPVGHPKRPEIHALTRSQMDAFWRVYREEDLTRSVPAILGWAADTIYWTGENYLQDTTAWTVNFGAVTPNFGGALYHGSTPYPTVSRVGW